MKYFSSLIFISVLLVSCQSQPNTDRQIQTSDEHSSTSKASTEKYANVEYGVSLSYPSGWKVEEKKSDEEGLAVYFTSPTASQNNSNLPRIALNAVKTGDIPEGVSMDMIEERALAEAYASNPQLKFMERYDTTVAGVPARVVVNSNIDYKGDAGKQTVAIFHSHGRLYTIMLLVLDGNSQDAQNQFETMLASLHIQ